MGRLEVGRVIIEFEDLSEKKDIEEACVFTF